MSGSPDAMGVKPPDRRFKNKEDREYAEQSASIIRGVLIDRLDDLADTRIRRLCEGYGFTESEFIRLLQEIQLALFPEEFAEQEYDLGLLPRAGVFTRPSGGKFGLGNNRMAAFAQLLRATADRTSDDIP